MRWLGKVVLSLVPVILGIFAGEVWTASHLGGAILILLAGFLQAAWLDTLTGKPDTSTETG